MNQLLKLSDVQLEASFRFYIKKERQILHLILEHIKEIARRDLHLRKYPSIVDYLVKEFGYSETAARLRVKAARLLSEIPELGEKIENGTMNLSMISELTRAVTEKESVTRKKVSAEQKVELVALISGKTATESQQDLAKALDIKVKDYEKQRIQQDGSVRHEFTASATLEHMLRQCRDLTAHQISQEHKAHSLESMLEIIADFYLAAHTNKKNDTAKIEKLEAAALAGVEKVNKSITPRMRRLVLSRDKCCQHKDKSSGQQCGSSFALQVDHIKPIWAGGTNAIGNLHALCASHNQFKYRQESQLRIG